MKRLELSDFESRIGTIFSFSRQWNGSSIGAEMVLTEATIYDLHKRDRRAKDTSGKYRSVPFSLFFEGRHSEPLPQGLYSVTHAAGAEPMDIFISCRGPNEENTSFLYEAVFG